MKNELRDKGESDCIVFMPGLKNSAKTNHVNVAGILVIIRPPQYPIQSSYRYTHIDLFIFRHQAPWPRLNVRVTGPGALCQDT